NHKIITSVIAILLLVGSLALTPLIGFSFMGSQEEKVMYLTYTPGTGELMDETETNVAKVEKELMKRKDIDILQVSINDPQNVDPSAMMMGGGAGGALMYLIFDKDMEDFPKAREEVEDYVFNIGQSGEWKSQNFSSMSMSSNEVSYTLYSEDLDKLRDAVKQVEGALKEVDGLEDIKSDNEDPYVEHVLKVEQKNVLQY
ncbi:efflux RND transporter permease subunit, partial [Bacillus sp. MHSD17]|nr:efflux RND transporter permease subunit [Bacillus sp. MHSD17]